MLLPVRARRDAEDDDGDEQNGEAPEEEGTVEIIGRIHSHGRTLTK